MQDCAAVLAIERQAYASEIQEPAAIVQARLRYEDDQYSSLNLGLYANDELVGYVLAHLDDGAEFPDGLVASNIYVADLAIVPAHRRGLAALVSALAREIRLEYPGLPIVAHAIEDTAQTWRRHDLLFRRLGFRMARTIENLATGPRHRASLIVWEPLPGSGNCTGKQRAGDRVALTAFESSSGQTLGTRIVEDEDGLIGLRESWQRLEGMVPGLTVFQTHRYQAAWVRSFGLDQKLVIVCVCDGDRIIGIAPFQVRRVEMLGKTYRQLSFLGAPWEVDRPRLLFGQDIRECAEATVQALLGQRDRWDVIWFHEQTAGDPALEAFCQALTRSGLLHGRAPSSRCPYLALDGTWQELLATKSQKFRKNLKSARNKLQSAGKLEFETCAGDVPRLQELFGEYEALERRGWKIKSGIGVSQSVEHLRFYRHLIDAFGASGEFVYRSLRLDGRLVAATFGLVHGPTFYSLHITHDPKHSKSSPGTYLESLELEECFRGNLSEYDFLGGFLTNKVRWATLMRDTVEVHVYQRQLRLLGAYAYFFVIKPPLKRFLARIGVRWPVKAEPTRPRETD